MAKIEMPFSARISAMPVSIPMSEKSSTPWMRKPFHPSSRSTTFDGTSLVAHTRESYSSVLPMKQHSAPRSTSE